MTNAITSHTLRDADTEITVLSMGCAIQDWVVGGRRVVLGYADVENYRENPTSMGIVIGRVANRIANSRFDLDGQTWDLPAREGQVHIHGGPGGLGWQNWTLEPQGDRAAVLRLYSPHLDQGYPGAVDFEVRLTLDGNALTWEMTATPDRVTPIAMAQHVYFNLAGTGTILDHRFRLNASAITPTDDALIPTGAIQPVDGTRFDFRTPRVLREIDTDQQGYDLNFALDGGDGPQVEAWAPDGTALKLWTNRKGMQFYTCTMLDPYGTPHPGIAHGPFAAFCIEAQDFPNAVNVPAFGSILCAPESPYQQRTTIAIQRG